MWHSTPTIHVYGEEAVLKNRKWYSSDKIIHYKGEEAGQSSFKFGLKKTQLIIEFKGALFTLQKSGLFSSTYDVYVGESLTLAGTITKDSAFKRNYTVDLPEKIDTLFQGVLVALIIIFENYKAAVAS